mgnify:CR=1 FL=1
MQNNKTINLLNALVPISRFNKGEANKIFNEVESDGIKIAVKNNKPACVLMSPGKYEEILDLIEDYKLFFEAERRGATPEDFLSQEEILDNLGIDDEELDCVKVEIE